MLLSQFILPFPSPRYVHKYVLCVSISPLQIGASVFSRFHIYALIKIWVPRNWCFWTAVLEKTLESLLNSKHTKLVNLKEIDPEYSWKDWCESWSSNTLATWCEELTHWKRPWCWERLRTEGEGGGRGCGSWMASLIQWTWVWVNSERWWWTGRPHYLQSMGSHSQTWLSNWT